MSPPKPQRPGDRKVCVNRKARHDYEIVDTIEAGIVLSGSEVKSLRAGTAQLADAYAFIGSEGVVLRNLEITAYSHDHTGMGESRRSRKLLLHAAEVHKLRGRLRESGMSLVPLSIYFKGPWAKCELAVARGRRKSDKRHALRALAAERDMDRARRRR
ncbi:MAG: SsrA-binding protein [Planctomycetota bacterium]|nr:MAG: SsrA-binding protein [Planctomycetota bacterium]